MRRDVFNLPDLLGEEVLEVLIASSIPSQYNVLKKTQMPRRSQHHTNHAVQL
jgi:hypothetical protein